MKESNYIFPEGFLWGTATASHQIEGGQNNDWSRWEQSPRRLAYLKKRGLDPLQFISGLAANSWENLEKDIECIKKLNNNAYRFSIEWSRIEPEEGEFDEAAIEKYHHFIKRLKEEGIEPFVTLWHWPLPLWLRDGWENPQAVEYFARYTEFVVRHCPEVKFWITLNEPEGYSGNSYLIGIWPPQKHSLPAHHRVLRNLSAAHNRAYAIIKQALPQSQISIAAPQAYFVASADPLSKLFRGFADWWWNKRFLSRIIDRIDFIGLNYYWEIRTKYLSYSKTKGAVTSDMGWTVLPEGMYHVLMNLKKYNKPIYITENGVADRDDRLRAWFITEMLKNIHRAIKDGVDVKGYLYWSLLDNFEWSHGFGQKFGLFAVDRKTWERIPRPSVKVYAEIAKNNRL